MLEADLTGSDAHGIFRLPGYVKALKRGAMNPRANIRELERGPATALIPFTYMQLLWATLIGWFVFHDFPDRWALCGMAVIAGSGL